MKAAVVGSCGFALVLGASAIANTPQQDLAYARWAKCNVPFAQLQRVGLDGRITFQFTTPRNGKRSCNASPTLAGRAHRSPSPSASACREARDRLNP